MCGHDGHMTCLLGAVQLIWKQRHKISSSQTIRLLFQPAEEGPGGAPPMIQEGCLTNVNEVYGMHNWSEGKVGSLSTVSGPLMAHITEFHVTISGKGGHSSQSHNCVDPVVCVAALATNLQTIVSRNVHYKSNAVVSVTIIKTGEATNVIPATAYIAGSIRDLSEEVFKVIEKRFFEIVEGTCKAFGCTYEIKWTPMYPVLVNHEEQTNHVKRIGVEMGLAVSGDYLPMMASEDFAYYLEKVPGCFYFLGGSEEGKENRFSCHHPKFDWNDNLTPVGVRFWIKLVEDRLGVVLYSS